MNDDPKGNAEPRSYLAIGIAVSAGVCVVLGTALDNIAVGIAFGIGAGLATEAALDA